MRQRAFPAWPLWVVLAAQTVLTLPWLWRTAPFTDEALYLQAGHQEWAHWLHHVPLHSYEFSGAPVFYPPLGAAADATGGLATARGLSLILMLGTTSALYFTAVLVSGRRTALFAAALFAVCGLVIHYGAFATYDAPALFFLTLGTWAAVHARHGYRWIGGAAAALAVANAAKYATLAWDPVVAGIVVFHTWDEGTAKALRRAAALAVSVAVLDAGLLALGGPGYVRAVITTTVFHSVNWADPSSPSSVLWRAFMISGVVVLPAALAVVVSIARRNPMPVSALLTLLLLAAFIAPIDQAHLHQLPSLDKNMGFGLPFAALGAGYAMSACIDWAGQHYPSGGAIASVGATALVLLVLVTGRNQTVQFRGPSSKVASMIVSAISAGYQRNTYIASDSAPWMEKYFLSRIPERAWLWIIRPTAKRQARLADGVHGGCISLVIMRVVGRSYHRPYDYRLRGLLENDPEYKLILTVSAGKYGIQIWRHEAPAAGWACQPKPWYLLAGAGQQAHAPVPAIRRWLKLKPKPIPATSPTPLLTPGRFRVPVP